jgi:hypothetical protein
MLLQIGGIGLPGLAIVLAAVVTLSLEEKAFLLVASA